LTSGVSRILQLRKVHIRAVSFAGSGAPTYSLSMLCQIKWDCKIHQMWKLNHALKEFSTRLSGFYVYLDLTRHSLVLTETPFPEFEFSVDRVAAGYRFFCFGVMDLRQRKKGNVVSDPERTSHFPSRDSMEDLTSFKSSNSQFMYQEASHCTHIHSKNLQRDTVSLTETVA